jgi:tRNA modification GTPase
LHGPAAWDAVRQFFRTRAGSELPTTPQAGRFWLGRLGRNIADEVVVAVKQVDPVPLLEAHCHGGREAVRLLLDLFRGSGLQTCTYDKFLRHTESDPLRAAAAIALSRAPTARTASILLDQYRGAFAVALDDIQVSLDRGEVISATARLDEMARYAALGRHLTVPWRVTVAGAPNVGKSSLVNALAGYQRSIVAATPGTTRDVVTLALAVDGWPVELSDTAGLRASGEALEEAGIHRAREAVAGADLCLWVLDASTEPVWPDASSGVVRFIVNKIDLPSAWDINRAEGAVRVSAQTGAGLAELCSALSDWLVPEVPCAGAAVPFGDPLSNGVLEARRLVAAEQTASARKLLRQMRSAATLAD